MASDYSKAHNNLGNALQDAGDPAGAFAAFRKAIDLDSRFAAPHYNLGIYYREQGQLGKSLEAYRRAVELDPRFAQAHNGMGIVYQSQGRSGEALASYHRAIAVDPNLAMPHYNLGGLFLGQGRLEEAAAAYQRCLDLNPRFARAHTGLGLVYQRLEQREEAIAAWRRAISLEPGQAVAHNNLGGVLLEKGQVREAAAAYRRASETAPGNTRLGASARHQLKYCQLLLALEARLPAFLAGTEQPADASEQVYLARLCKLKGLYAAAARCYCGAFTAADLPSQDRYRGACAAALASAGHGDADRLADSERARLRRQALTWLKADLAAWAKLIEDSQRDRPHARSSLQRWRRDSDLASIRDAGALARLPREEQQACLELWKAVDALLQKAKE
jgi:tetratricopeptide (TPR) repeat protein